MATETLLPPAEFLPNQEDMSASPWMAIRTNRGKELLVEKQLQTEKVETFIPWEKGLSQRKKNPKNFLPNYLFVRANENESMGWMKKIRGVKYVLPGRVPNSDVQEIKNALHSNDPAERLKEVFDQELSPEQRILAILEVRPLRPA